MRTIPPTWAWAKFGDIASVDSNLVAPARYPDLPHIAPNHIESHSGRLLPHQTVREDGVTSSKHLFREGHLLYSKIRPYLAKAVVVGFEGLCSADMYPISTSLDVAFLHWWMLTPEFTAYAAGEQGRSVLPKINQRDLSRLPVPVPPLPEQRRIVAAIEEHLSSLDAAGTGLARARGRLGAARRSIVDGAFARLGHAPTHLGREVFSFITSGSRGWAKYYSSSGPMFIRVGDIPRAGIQLDLSGVQLVSPPEGAEGRRTRAQPGDLLITITADIGRVAVFPPGLEAAYINQHVALARPIDGLNSEFLAWFISSSSGQGQLGRLQRGATKAGLGLDDIRELRVPIPSASQQSAIAERLAEGEERLRHFAGDLDRALQWSAGLRRSVLAAAFTGRLVPQNPSDEPASVLLERIAAERAVAKPSRRKKAAS